MKLEEIKIGQEIESYTGEKFIVLDFLHNRIRCKSLVDGTIMYLSAQYVSPVKRYPPSGLNKIV